MSTPEHFVLLAAYNADMNRNLYAAAAKLTPDELTADRKAFFGSVAGTMNHLLAGDTIWLKRFATHPANFPALSAMSGMPQPGGLAHSFSDDLATLRRHREQLDAIINAWARQLTAADLAHAFEYRSTKGDVYRKRFGSVLAHFFNHQTHHRGQASTLLTQAGVDIGVTDLLLWVPDLEPATP
ncbi:DinB family protein [Oxalobacteraceae bacterium OTU3CINTB1]|nr:DinB family protein [Oxalobacteraceae bacterium OTU3CINTB1]